MALFGGTQFVVGYTLGLGTGIIAREAIPYLWNATRPISRVVVKSSIAATERVREGLMFAGESIGEWVAEARQDYNRRAEVMPVRQRGGAKPKRVRRRRGKTMAEVRSISERRSASA